MSRVFMESYEVGVFEVSLPGDRRIVVKRAADMTTGLRLLSGEKSNYEKIWSDSDFQKHLVPYLPKLDVCGVRNGTWYANS